MKQSVFFCLLQCYKKQKETLVTWDPSDSYLQKTHQSTNVFLNNNGFTAAH